MARWQSCNVLHVRPDGRSVWQFEARKDDFALSGEKTVPVGQKLPATVGGRTWHSLWQKKLNVAWLPPEQVFLRAIQLPKAEFDETLSMVELQLEKLSPLPLAQVVWSFHSLPQVVEGQQTLIVVIAARTLVEEYLGQIETQGYLADRLELALIEELARTPADREGAWIYPETAGGANTALVAWWFGGALQQLSLVSAPPGPKRAETLSAQLTQTAWAGELEGWLKGKPRLYLVATPEVAEVWEPLLREGLKESADIIPPLPVQDLATATARRAAKASPKASLLPAEFAARYQQQFVDRLWMRGLGAILLLYIVGAGIYLGALWVKTYQARQVEQQVADKGGAYTNVLKLKARYLVLKDRQDLRYAALDVWKATANLLPEGATLDQLTLADGKKFSINGTASVDVDTNLNAFTYEMRQVQVNGQPLIGRADPFWFQRVANTIQWRFSCELNRVEGP